MAIETSAQRLISMTVAMTAAAGGGGGGFVFDGGGVGSASGHMIVLRYRPGRLRHRSRILIGGADIFTGGQAPSINPIPSRRTPRPGRRRR